MLTNDPRIVEMKSPGFLTILTNDMQKSGTYVLSLVVASKRFNGDIEK
jgi:hypothetical protein